VKISHGGKYLLTIVACQTKVKSVQQRIAEVVLSIVMIGRLFQAYSPQ